LLVELEPWDQRQSGVEGIANYFGFFQLNTDGQDRRE
jgi:hypothetical protein